jgi:hypothetical protein
MENQNRISEKYRKKIKLFFAQDWFLLSVAVITIFYSLANYLSNNSFVIFKIHLDGSLLIFIISFFLFTVKFIISNKLKSRLIYEVIDETKFYSLVVYNKAVVTLDKTLVPLPKYKPDYFINSLFSTRLGTINLPGSKSERFVVKIDNNKYYFLPFLFDSEILI